MDVCPLKKDLADYLKKRNLWGRFIKQVKIFKENPFYPSLNTEILEPKHLRIYSFRITRNWRAVFIYRGSNQIEIVDINNHYK